MTEGKSDRHDRILETMGRLHVVEHLLMQLLHEGLQDGDRKVFVAKALQNLEDELHREIPLLDGDRKRVGRHALESLKQIIGTLTLNLFDASKKPV